MKTRKINADESADALGSYTHALEVSGTTRRLYISGQAPMTKEGTVPVSFREQAETVWDNILAQLHAAEMKIENIVQATTYLVDRHHRGENREVRDAKLGGHTFALTVVLAGLFEEGWMLEIDAIAEA